MILTDLSYENLESLIVCVPFDQIPLGFIYRVTRRLEVEPDILLTFFKLCDETITDERWQELDLELQKWYNSFIKTHYLKRG